MYSDSAVELTKELVRIESFSVEGKQKITEFMYRKIMKETSADVRIIGRDTENPYVIAHYKNGEGCRLLLQGHLDTVSPGDMNEPLNPVEKDGEIYGRGSCDMKAGCACNYAAFKYACDHHLEGEVYLMYSTDEETYAQQTVDAFEKGLLPVCDLAVIPEPTNQNLMAAQKGNAWIKITFFGRSAHASIPEKGENAIYMAIEFINQFKKFTSEKYIHNTHPLLGQAKMNVGMIEAGTEANSVPAECSIVIDKRYLPNENITDFQEEIDIVAEEVKHTYPAFNYRADVIVDCTPMEIDRESEKFTSVKKVLEETFARQIEVGVFGGWGEGGTLDKYQTDTIYFGPGSNSFAHTAEERVGVQAVKEVTDGLIAVLNNKCQ